MLSGALTEEDEEAVEAELESIIQEQMPSVPEEEELADEVEPQLPDVPAEPGISHSIITAHLFHRVCLCIIIYIFNLARHAGSAGSMSASGSAGPGFNPRRGSKFSFENFQPRG